MEVSATEIFSTKITKPLGARAAEILLNRVFSNAEFSVTIKWYPSDSDEFLTSKFTTSTPKADNLLSSTLTGPFERTE